MDSEPKDCAHTEKHGRKRARESSGGGSGGKRSCCKPVKRHCSKRRRSRSRKCGARRKSRKCGVRRHKSKCGVRRHKSRCGRSRHRRKKTHRTCCRTPCGTFKRCRKCDKRWKLRLPKRCRSHSR
ncbi:sperm histone P2a [Plutella xylostella]|uniref:sperm histone P2a n=1 Tax=Plutella xylostella TaxID=51655 RepID=UPI00203273B7|nr:sperm histone P2a [Plutella xylostella]